MVLGRRGAVGLQFILRCGGAGVLGVFVEAASAVVSVGRIGGGADRHLEVLFAF